MIGLITFREVSKLYLELSISVYPDKVNKEQPYEAKRCAALLSYSFQTAEKYAGIIAKRSKGLRCIADKEITPNLYSYCNIGWQQEHFTEVINRVFFKGV